MKKIFAILLSIFSLSATAQVKIADFEDIPVGTKWTMWGVYGGTGTSTATVEADPKNSSNHVLHIRLKDWNTFPEFDVPSELAGIVILGRCNSVRFRLYRSTSETDDYKQMHVYYGSDQIYADQSYPFQGDKGVWQNRSYDLKNIPESSTATKLRLGIHHSNSDYYIDDVMLYGPYDDFVTVPSGEVNICVKNTSDSYSVYSTPTMIPENTSLKLITSRYTDITAPFAGTGTLNIHAGGERTFLGNHSDKKYPDWSLFTGNVHVYPYKNVEMGAGFYGIVMAHNGKTFSPENIQGCLDEGKVCTMLGDNSVTLHEGAAIAFENGTRAARFGELNTVPGSRIYGYYKASDAGAYLLVGHLGTDATLAGRIAPMEKNGTPLASQLLGIIKEGRGTYHLTSSDNVIPGGIRVTEGRFDVDGAATAPAYVFDGARLGGTGRISGTIDNYGIVASSALTVTSLRVHPASTVRFGIRNTNDFDALEVVNAIEYSTQTQNFSTSDAMPRLRIALEGDYALNVGDEFTVLTYASMKNADQWQWDVLFPSRYTWEMVERTTDNGRLSLVVRVVSLDDDPANAGNDEEEDAAGDDHPSSDTTSIYGDDGDTHPLRYYADQQSVRIGVAVSSYNDVNNTSDQRIKLITDNFNMVVPENNLKFESVEPSQNVFNYAGGDALANYARNKGMYMRGHTLAWHSQVAQWVSVDGKKNDKNWTKAQLMAILKNHILNVVGHFKGKIGEWDVVNECLDDDQSIVRTNPDGYKLRQQSIWTTVCGEEFIDSAFVWARQADPDVKLYLNEYGNEFLGTAKAQAFYNLVKRLKNSGIPVDGVGFQCHFDAGQVDSVALEQNIARFAPLGVECAITELDLGVKSITESELQQQARDYHAVVSIAAHQPHCRSVLVWGLSDDQSWRSSNPLLWNSAQAKKPAYYAVRHALRDSADAIEEVTESASPVVAMQWYSLNGTKLSAPSGVCICRQLHKDGSVTVRKSFYDVNHNLIQ